MVVTVINLTDRMVYTAGMQITVFGASGKVGQQVVALALAQGYTVKAFVHSRDPFSKHAQLSVVKGDITDSASVAKALSGSEAVISALGSWGTPTKTILSSGMEIIIPLMETQGIDRIITLTGNGALWSGDKMSIFDKFNHRLLLVVAPKILLDGEAHIRLLAASKLRWTTVRSPVMTSSSRNTYRLDTSKIHWVGIVPRHAVSQALLDQVSDDNYVCQAPVIY